MCNEERGKKKNQQMLVRCDSVMSLCHPANLLHIWVITTLSQAPVTRHTTVTDLLEESHAGDISSHKKNQHTYVNNSR